MVSSFMEEPAVKIHKRDVAYLETYSTTMDFSNGFLFYTKVAPIMKINHDTLCFQIAYAALKQPNVAFLKTIVPLVARWESLSFLLS